MTGSDEEEDEAFDIGGNFDFNMELWVVFKLDALNCIETELAWFLKSSLVVVINPEVDRGAIGGRFCSII